MYLQDALVELAYSIRRVVRPLLGLHSSRQLSGKASSGDESFEIDKVAEKELERFIRQHNLPVAYYSEDRGVVETTKPEHLLVIDPIDGTRPAMAGFEQCVVSIAMAPYKNDARLSDVTFACLLEIKEDVLITATRDKNFAIQRGNRQTKACLSPNTSLDTMAWTCEMAGRPSDLIVQVLHPLIDISSLRGGCSYSTVSHTQ